MDRNYIACITLLFINVKMPWKFQVIDFEASRELAKVVATSASANNQILMHLESCETCDSFALAKGNNQILHTSIQLNGKVNEILE